MSDAAALKKRASYGGLIQGVLTQLLNSLVSISIKRRTAKGCLSF